MSSTQVTERFVRWVRESADDSVLRWLYRGLVIATVGVLVVDISDPDGAVATKTTASPSSERPTELSLPSAPSWKNRPGTSPAPRTDARMRQPMTFDLAADGRLLAFGTIVPGSAEAFRAEIDKRGSYVKTVVLRSPGGSVTDSLAMGRLIRERKFATEVEGGHYCASSCPLVFAGGTERRVGRKAAVGVHQVAAAESERLSGPAGMESGQKISAACQKHLRDLGIDLGVWIRAMETPNDEIYYFKPDELLSLRLATSVDDKDRIRS